MGIKSQACKKEPERIREKMSRTKKKIPGAQPTTPTASTAAIPALLPEDSPATEGTCVMPDGGDAENIAAPDVMRLDEKLAKILREFAPALSLLGSMQHGRHSNNWMGCLAD